MKLFWANGYTATSLPELLKAMGIARSSFYASFHTKRDLFIECLELFGDRTLKIVDEHARDQSAAALPRAFFEATLLDVSPRRVSNGCLMVNTVLELADVDAELSALATSKLTSIEQTFAHAFDQAQRTGQLHRARSPQDLARLVMTVNLGLRVKSRQNLPAAELKLLIEDSLAMLDLAA